MLINFCDPRLKTEVYCSTVHTEGYDVTNLINGSSKGFLAYSCIRPPVNIDFTFVCNVQIHYVLLWPAVGSQRSSGFQLHSKTTTDSTTPYTMLASGCLKSDDAGLLFYSRRVNVNKITAPATFLKRYVPARMECLMNYTNSLRVCIWKTENSVPALSRIEVWGTVSPRCGKDTIANIYALWKSPNDVLPSSTNISTNSTSDVKDVPSRHKASGCLEVPEDFLDEITCEIMTQPVILPSGKTIDQTTLDKHEANEAVWGRSPSDPFTGLPFTEKRRPIVATTLKAKIDKFLVDNSDTEEVKRIPRVLGYAKRHVDAVTRTAVISNKTVIGHADSRAEPEAHCFSRTLETHKISGGSREQLSSVKIKHTHRLPVATIRHKRTSSLVKTTKKVKTLDCPRDVPQDDCDRINELFDETSKSSDGVENDLNAAVKNVLSTLKHFSGAKRHDQESTRLACNCCSNAVLYRLPCAHIVCRKVLTSITDEFKCKVCKESCAPRDIERIYSVN